MMTNNRIYTDDGGESRFEGMEVSLAEEGEIGLLSAPYAVESLVLRETDFSYDYDFHQASFGPSVYDTAGWRN